jgi:phytoene dehydrogenase-like protein
MIYDAVIIGAGLSGLSCALKLYQSGASFVLIEKSDSIGGRVKTDFLQDYKLDRGFQALFTAYPQAQSILDYPSLNLKQFYPGALIRFNNKFHHLSDPWRKPMDSIKSLLNPIGSLSDKIKIGNLRRHINSKSLETIFTSKDTETIQYLREVGFSEQMIDRFFKPLLGGIFCDSSLSTSSIMFEFIFSMMSLGSNVLPSEGMQAIPDQIYNHLPYESALLNTSVSQVTSHAATLLTGEQIKGQAVIIATDGPSATELITGLNVPRYKGATCIYFSADTCPEISNALVLNGTGQGPINHLCVPSNVSQSYAPIGKSLISTTVLETQYLKDANILSSVRTQLTEWFGNIALEWEHLKTYNIAHVQPEQTPPLSRLIGGTTFLNNGVLICGDYRENGSIQGALTSGRIAGELALDMLNNR